MMRPNHLGKDDQNVVVLESDEDVLLYETGHIPGALKIDWHTDLNDPGQRRAPTHHSRRRARRSTSTVIHDRCPLFRNI